MARAYPTGPWRSHLFAPAATARLVGKAQIAGRDAVILDLEDAVAASAKEDARRALEVLASEFAADGPALLVRVNNDPGILEADVEALPNGVAAVVLPKVVTLNDIERINALLGARALAAGGDVGVLALIEGPAAFFNLQEIATAPGVIALALGSEDFAGAMRVPPTPELLRPAAVSLCMAGAAAGRHVYAVPSSIAAYRDLDAWREAATYARAIGASGGLCIHPAQAAVLNAAFAPDEQELAWAAAVVETWEQADGAGVATHNGQMIDLPVLNRARGLLALTRGR